MQEETTASAPDLRSGAGRRRPEPSWGGMRRSLPRRADRRARLLRRRKGNAAAAGPGATARIAAPRTPRRAPDPERGEALDPPALFPRPGGRGVAGDRLRRRRAPRRPGWGAPARGHHRLRALRQRVVKLLRAVDDGNLRNVRVWDEDATALLAALPDASLARVYLLYPDPWPKRRQRKRRFVSDASLAEIARLLRPAGISASPPTSTTMPAGPWSAARCSGLRWTARGPPTTGARRSPAGPAPATRPRRSRPPAAELPDVRARRAVVRPRKPGLHLAAAPSGTITVTLRLRRIGRSCASGGRCAGGRALSYRARDDKKTRGTTR